MITEPANHRSVDDGKPVVDVGDTGRRPGRLYRRVVLRPRAHGSGEDRGPVHRFDGDVVGVELGVALHRLLDGVLDVAGVRGRAGQVHVVLDAGHPGDVAGDEVGL